MSQRSLIIISGILVFVAIVVAGLWWYFGRTSTTTTKIALPTTNQQTLEVNNFLPNGSNANASVDVYSQIANGQYSGLSYDQQTHRFTLSFNATDFSEFSQQRTGAEQHFIALLGITEAQACTLLVEERNTPSPDPDLNGRVFPLSFCK